MPYQNPYYNQTFFSFFLQFFMRIWAFIRGDLGLHELASDEIQIFVLIGVSTSAALVGTFLVLRRMTMLANALSHTILLGIAIAFFFAGGSESHLPLKAMLVASLGMGLVTAFLTQWLTKVGRLQEDASTGLVFTTLFAMGIILVTVLTKGAHIGLEAIMGNVDALHTDDLKFVYLILSGNILLFLLFFKGFKITTFDPALAHALGFSTIFFNYLLMLQVSATVIGAFRAVGVLMVLAFITGPALTARLLTNHLKTMLISAACIGTLSSIVGVALSRHLLTTTGAALSTAGIVVCTILLIYVLTLIGKYIGACKRKGAFSLASPHIQAKSFFLKKRT
jgi:manganese/zinc/iron transport system permease protein